MRSSTVSPAVGRESWSCLRPGRPASQVLETPTTHIGGAVAFDGARFFPAPKLRMLDRASQFALVAAAQAVRDAGMVFDNMDRQRSGVFVGTGMGGAQTTDDGYFTLYAEGSARVKPYSVLMAMTNAAASWIGIEYGLKGPNLTYSTACSSSAVAIGEAARRIASGEVDVMIAGGTEAPLNYGTLIAWDALKTLATADPEDPGASCKPFAKDRTGLVLGEGAAIVILEDWQHAQARGARVRAELVGLRPLHRRDAHHAALGRRSGGCDATGPRICRDAARRRRLHQRPRHRHAGQRRGGNRGDQAGIRRVRATAFR